MKRKSISGKLICKIFAVATLPTVLFVWVITLIVSAGIDFIAFLQDDAHLSDSETRKRRTNRQNKLLHDVVKFPLDYITQAILG